MRKIFGLFVVLAVVLTVNAFAGGSSESSSSSSAAKSVSIWGWRTQDAPLWKEVNARLAKMGDNVTINYESFVPTEYDSKALVALQGGTGPDIMYTRRLPGQRTQALIDGNYIVSLTGKVDLTNFTEQTLNSLSSGGKAWGIPFANQVVGIFYNKDIFAKYNLAIPKTWNDLVTVAKTLKSNGETPFFISGKAGWTLAMQNAMVGVSLPGETWIKEVIDGKTTFTSPQYVDLLTKLNDLKAYYQKDFLANSTDDMDAAFAFGKAAMVFYGIWGGTNWKKLNPDFNYGFFPVPPENANQPAAVYVYMDGGYGLNAASKNQDAALKVLKYTATKEFGTLFSQTTGELTAVKGATIPDNNPIGQLAYKDSTTIGAKYIYWVGSPFENGTPTVYSILQNDMQSMYIGNMTPTQLAQKIQDGVATWYPAFKK
ncbi:MAG TPA: extracellular solute-binding protein [Spirochaetia bacterium]|nr:extracellular solute-binding protein [Spirochaetia bacterium]